MSLAYAYSMSLSHGAMPGWPAVCDCGISLPYVILFVGKIALMADV